jgi:hypothetical protein
MVLIATMFFIIGIIIGWGMCSLSYEYKFFEWGPKRTFDIILAKGSISFPLLFSISKVETVDELQKHINLLKNKDLITEIIDTESGSIKYKIKG